MNDEPQAPTKDEPFSQMAERIKRNVADGFGGACVIVAPDNGGDPIEILIVVPKGGKMDLAQFYATITSRIQTTLEELNQQNAVAQGFGRR